METMKKSNKILDIAMENAIYYIDNLEDEIIDGENPISGDINEGLVIFKPEDVEKLIASQTRASTLKPRLEAMVKEGNWRPHATVTDEVLNSLDLLKVKFPNFDAVIDRYTKSLSLASLSEPKSIYVPPILLVGEPGVGKTRFLRDLALTLKICFFNIDLATVSAGFVLAGSTSTWAEGKPGAVSDSLRKSKVSNPIILLDEIDKASGDVRYDPLGCLYSLLERQTATSFKDEALEIEMDCSCINWVASSNYIESIPQPIMSRFIVYHVEAPSLEQMSLVAQSVYSDLLAENSWGQLFEPELSTDVIDCLIEFSPREQKRALYSACCEAAFRCHNIEGAILSILPEDIILIDSKPIKRAIGFY
jgi:ATP-dependent Lon protease